MPRRGIRKQPDGEVGLRGMYAPPGVQAPAEKGLVAGVKGLGFKGLVVGV